MKPPIDLVSGIILIVLMVALWWVLGYILKHWDKDRDNWGGFA